MKDLKLTRIFHCSHSGFRKTTRKQRRIPRTCFSDIGGMIYTLLSELKSKPTYLIEAPTLAGKRQEGRHHWLTMLTQDIRLPNLVILLFGVDGIQITPYF